MTRARKPPLQNTSLKNSKAKTQKISKGRFKTIFLDHFNIIIGVAVTISGLLTFFLTPLKDVTYHFLYKEKAQVKLFTENSHVYLGDSLSINILVLPVSKIDVSDGICEIFFDEEYLRIAEGEKIFNFSSIEGPKFIIDNYKTKFLTLKPGNSFVKTNLQTRYNVYSDSLQVKILPLAKSEKPTRFDFSGPWLLKMGLKNGQMDLKENNRSLSGSYSFDDGESGVISGLRDGSVFIVDLIRKGELTKWHVQANWKADNQYLQIDGRSFQWIIKNSSWVRLDTTSHRFYSMVVLNP